MMIVPEKLFVHANPESSEMTVVMDGFRMTLSRTEGELLRDALDQGLKQFPAFFGDLRRPALVGAPDAERSEAKKLTVMPA